MRLTHASLEIGAHDVDEFVCRLDLGRSRLLRRVNDVMFDVALNDFSQQTIHRTTACRDVLQHGAGVLLRLETLLNRRNLTCYPPDAIEELLLIANGVTHRLLRGKVFEISAICGTVEAFYLGEYAILPHSMQCVNLNCT